MLGWLLAQCGRQLAVVIHAEEVFHAQEDTHRAFADFARRVNETLGKKGRCSIEEVEEGAARRFLVHNFRRVSSGAPKKILL